MSARMEACNSKSWLLAMFELLESLVESPALPSLVVEDLRHPKAI